MAVCFEASVFALEKEKKAQSLRTEDKMNEQKKETGDLCS